MAGFLVTLTHMVKEERNQDNKNLLILLRNLYQCRYNQYGDETKVTQRYTYDILNEEYIRLSDIFNNSIKEKELTKEQEHKNAELYALLTIFIYVMNNIN